MDHQKTIFKNVLPIAILLLATHWIWAQPVLKSFGKVVHYELYVRDTLVNFSGKKIKRAIAVNGQIPMPTLTFTEGDTAEIVVHNQLKESTSLHWHGLYLPNKEDGVPYLTQMPIAPNETFTYRFPIIQNGTHWYHSHSGLQEQIGMYGSMILLKKVPSPSERAGDKASTFRKGIDDIPAIPIILSEWTDLNPNNVHRMLHNASDWFAIKKGTTQSYAEAIRAGHFKTKVKNEWKRMLAMDVSDVYYEKLLINGRNESQVEGISPLAFGEGSRVRSLKAGDKVRLRISNGGASSYFWLTYAGGKMTVVASDGNDVEPVEVDRLIIGVSETYDVIVSIPAENTSYEFLATSEDRIKSASLYLGNGVKQIISPLPKLKYFEGMKMMNGMMKMNGDLDDMGMNMSLNQMDMNVVMYPEITGSPQGSEEGIKKKNADKMKGMEMKNNHANHSGNQYNPNSLSDIKTLNYAMLKSPTKTTFQAPLTGAVGHSSGTDGLQETPPTGSGGPGLLKFTLTGNMNRYVWSLDNRVLSETDKILIKKGDQVRIVIYNNSMMRHPMHLHGHDFRVLNGQGEYAPLKNVLDIMPMETDTIVFEANAEGDWFFHCHILYHMMAGMNRVFSYQEPYNNPYIPNRKKAYKKLQKESNRLHLMAENDVASNGNDGMVMLQNTRWSIGTEWRLGYNDMHGYETETHIGRYMGKMQWLMPFIGFDWRYRKFGIDEQETNLFGQSNSKDSRKLFSIGFNYTLPMLLVFQAEVFHKGDIRFQLMREDIPISKRLRAGFMINTDKEFMADLRYIVSRNTGIRAHYDSDMGFGAGLSLNY